MRSVWPVRWLVVGAFVSGCSVDVSSLQGQHDAGGTVDAAVDAAPGPDGAPDAAADAAEPQEDATTDGPEADAPLPMDGGDAASPPDAEIDVTPISCTADGQCPTDYYCTNAVAGVCTAKQADGAQCSGDSLDPSGAHQCRHGNCVDGVCCNNACAGTCQACTAALTGGVDGTCGYTLTGTDARHDCGSYACNGAGACYASCTADTQCSATAYCVVINGGSCPGTLNTCTPRLAPGAPCCTGNQCQTSCAPNYHCAFTQCSRDDHCPNGQYCYVAMGLCFTPGHCAQGYECATGYCRILTSSCSCVSSNDCRAHEVCFPGSDPICIAQ